MYVSPAGSSRQGSRVSYKTSCLFVELLSNHSITLSCWIGNSTIVESNVVQFRIASFPGFDVG